MGRTAAHPPPVLLAALLALTCIAYLPALSGGFVWDDDAYVTDNTLLRTGEGLQRIWTTLETPQYYPLVFTTFWVEYHLWGLDPFGYHLVNVGLHAGNAILLCWILWSLQVPGAGWIAVLFAVHPVHVESVAWITERKNVLSGLFYLLALAAYLRFESARRGRPRRVPWYALSLGLFLCALLSKTVTSTLPVVLSGLVWFRHGRITRADLLRLGPFFALALGAGSVTVSLERHMVGAVSYDFQLSWVERLAIAARALVFYAQKLLLPHPLIFNYPRFGLEPLGFRHLWPLLVIVATAVGLAWCWRRGWRSPVAGVLYFSVTLFPALGFFDVYPFRYSFVADHFQYLASVGLLGLVVQAGRASRRPGLGWAVGILVTLVLGILTWRQCGAYADAEALWKDTLAKNPSSWLANNNLGALQRDRGELDAALASFERALAANPTSTESHTGRGMVRARLGQAELALQDFDEAIRLDPSYPLAYLHRGELLQTLGRHEQVVEDFTRVLQSRPDYLPALQARGRAYVGLGRFAEAVDDFTRAIELGANFEAYNDRGSAHLRRGAFADALADFDRALELNPDATYIRHNRGAAYAQLGQVERALRDFDEVLLRDPDAANTYRLRGALRLRALGDPQRACADWSEACRLGHCAEYRAHCGKID